MVEAMRPSGLTYDAIADLAHIAPVTIWRISNNLRADVSYSTGLGVERAYAHVIGAGSTSARNEWSELAGGPRDPLARL